MTWLHELPDDHLEAWMACDWHIDMAWDERIVDELRLRDAVRAASVSPAERRRRLEQAFRS